ncbi:MAG TPA: sigma-54 dependent transcriptional regulator [Elusimicrobiota bacterium]|jgi:DNA-binding NtrC family response regulator|nr:sigma-54 dependent transcriptional regulator [Elusimicrobiota bacterium]
MPSRPERILVVDDEAGMCRLLQAVLGDAGYAVTAHQKPEEALRSMEREPYDLVISDIRMPKLTGVDLLQAVREKRPDIPVILITAHGSTRSAVEAIRLGTSDYITKPFKNEEIRLVVESTLLRSRLTRENRLLRQELSARDGFGGMVGISSKMRAAFRALAEAAESDAPFLIEGAPGTGRELAARTIHEKSRRAAGPFATLDCGEPAAAEELFGRFQGSFAAARGPAGGAIASAARGTLLLKRVEALPDEAQGRLARFLKELQVRLPGSIEATALDTRIAAAAEDPARLRPDLAQRLAPRVVLPPLRERPEDILPIVEHFLERRARRRGAKPMTLEPAAAEILLAHPWPGNVRELEAAVEHAASLARDGAIAPAHLPASVARFAPTDAAGGEPSPFREAKQQVVDAFEKSYLTRLLKLSEGNMTRAAQLADMDRKNLYDLLKKHGLDPR